MELGSGKKEGVTRREEVRKREMITMWCMEEGHRVRGALSSFCLSSFNLFAFPSHNRALA